MASKHAASSHPLLHIFKHAVHVVVCHATQSDCTPCAWPLYVGERVAYFLGPVPQDKLPKDAAPGNCLAGSLKLGLLQGSKEHAPGAFPIFYRSPSLILSMPGCFLLRFNNSCLRSCCSVFFFSPLPMPLHVASFSFLVLPF